MNDIPTEELDEKFNELLNDPEQEDLIDEIKKNALVKAYGNIDDEKIIEEAERKDKSESLQDVVNLSQRSQEKIKDMSFDEIIKYRSLEDLIDYLED